MLRFILRLLARSKKNDAGFGTGLKPQPIDKRDYEEPLGTGEFDWDAGYDIEKAMTEAYETPFKIPVHNQGGSSSCVGQAWTYYGSVKNYFEIGGWTKASAKDVYSWIYAIWGGAYLRDGAKRYTNQGVLPEKEWPSYWLGNPPTETFMRQRAKDSKVYDQLRQVLKSKEYRSVANNTIDDAAKAIEINGGMVIGVNGENNGTWGGVYPQIPTKRDWGHALYCGKAVKRNGKKYIGVLNSWGMVGEDGWQYLGEEWWTSRNVFDGWVLSDQPNQIEREVDYEKMTTFIASEEYKKDKPMPGNSFYHSQNWLFIQNKTGVTDISAGMYYDYSQAKKLRDKYNI